MRIPVVARKKLTMAGLFALVVFLASSTCLLAQTVSVTVLNGDTGQPVTGAIVYLTDDSGTHLARRLTNDDGRALFFRHGTGMQSLQAEMIGMAAARTEAFSVDHGSTIHRELVLEPRAISLEGLSVETGRRCRADPSEGPVAAQLWEEARKALTAASIADEERLYRFRTLLYEQDLDRDSEVVRRSRQSTREASMDTPFRSRPLEHLMQHGFVEHSGGVDLYLAPDADVLLSGDFLDTHCFGVRVGREGTETEDFVGLTFEPVPDRSHVVEVAGALWLDPNTSELQWMEYRYVNLEPDVALDEVGGRVEFQRMPDGGWIIPEWWIRMPRIALQQNLAGDEYRTYVAGFREAGGRVLDVQGPGRILGHRVSGAMEGEVVDSLGDPLPDVRVELVGSDLSTVTDSTGSFTFYPLVEGIYEVRVVDPELERFGYPATELTKAVLNGETTLVDVEIPSVGRLLTQSCVEAPSLPEWEEMARDYPSRGIIFGRVLDAEGSEPVEDAVVEVVAPILDFQPGTARQGDYAADIVLGGVNLNESEVIIRQHEVGFQTRTNEQGFYRICNVPEGHRMFVTVVVGGVESEVGPIRITEAAGRQEVTVRVAPGA